MIFKLAMLISYPYCSGHVKSMYTAKYSTSISFGTNVPWVKQTNPSEDTTEIGHQRALICINPRWPPKWPPDPWSEANIAYISGSRPHSFMILGCNYRFSGSIYPMDMWPWHYKVKVTLQGQGHHVFLTKFIHFIHISGCR